MQSDAERMAMIRRAARNGTSFLSWEKFSFLADLEARGLIAEKSPLIFSDMIAWDVTEAGVMEFKS